MSILIKGMTMPKNCLQCQFCTYFCTSSDGSKESYFCRVLNKSVGGKAFCPLIELPPHGDLIGREWLIDIALHLMNTAKNDDIANGVKWLWQYVIEAPAIIESEE